VPSAALARWEPSRHTRVRLTCRVEPFTPDTRIRSEDNPGLTAYFSGIGTSRTKGIGRSHPGTLSDLRTSQSIKFERQFETLGRKDGADSLSQRLNRGTPDGRFRPVLLHHERTVAQPSRHACFPGRSRSYVALYVGQTGEKSRRSVGPITGHVQTVTLSNPLQRPVQVQTMHLTSTWRTPP